MKRKNGQEVGPVDLGALKSAPATVPGVVAEANFNARHHARVAAQQLGAADARARSAAEVLEAVDRNQRDGMAQTLDTLIGEHRRIADVHATTALALAAAGSRIDTASFVAAAGIIGTAVGVLIGVGL